MPASCTEDISKMENTEYAQREKEYTIQHFGFDPSTLVEEITEDSFDYLSQGLGAIKQQVIKKKSGKFKVEELEKGLQAVEHKYKEFFERKLDSLAVYLNEHVFKIPQHVLLNEDSPWDDLSQSVAKSRSGSVNAEMEKMREKYKTLLYKKTYLRCYMEKLKGVCISQEETIQREVCLKEKFGLVEVDEMVGFLSSQQNLLSTKLNSLNQLNKNLKRRTGVPECSKEKRQKLETDIKQKLSSLRNQQIQCSQ